MATETEARNLLTEEQIDHARATGRAWGQAEADDWRDNHGGSLADAPDWTLGAWAGNNPFDRDDERYDAFDLLVDLAARNTWDSERRREAVTLADCLLGVDEAMGWPAGRTAGLVDAERGPQRWLASPGWGDVSRAEREDRLAAGKRLALAMLDD